MSNEPDIRAAKRKARWLLVLFVLVPVTGVVLFQLSKSTAPLFIGVGFDLGLMAWAVRQPWYELLRGQSNWLKW